MNLNNSISEIEYSLARHIPDMIRGFSIDTNYGSLQVSPYEPSLEKEFKAIVDSVENYLLKQLQLEGGAAS